MDRKIIIPQPIFGTRINRELVEIFESTLGHEREVETGLFLSTVCDTPNGLLNSSVELNALNNQRPTKVTERQTKQRELLFSASSPPFSEVHQSSLFSPGHSLRPIESVLLDDGTPSLRDTCDLLRESVATPDRIVRWSPELGVMKLSESKSQATIKSEAGVRLLVRFTHQYFKKWGIVIPNELLDRSVKTRFSNSNDTNSDPNRFVSCHEERPCSKQSPSVDPIFSDSTFSDSTFSDSVNVCIVIIEVPSDYPMRSPRIGITHFAIEQELDWYDSTHQIFNSIQQESHSIFSSSNSLSSSSKRSVDQFLSRHLLPLTHLNPYHTTSLILRESWSPAISLSAVIERLSAVIREEVIAHVHHLQIDDKREDGTTELQQNPHHSVDSLRTYSEIATHTPIPDDNNDRKNNRKNNRETSELRYPLRYPWLSLWSVLLISVTIRILFGNQPHSGQFNAPVYGDYEAQRHWKQLTINLPINKWYTHVEHQKGDALQKNPYWNLDYPPLTAFHEYFLGRLSRWFEPESVSNESHGYLTQTHKLFMRWSVILSDLIVFHTAAVFFWIALPDEFLVSKIDRAICSFSSHFLHNLFALFSLIISHLSYFDDCLLLLKWLPLFITMLLFCELFSQLFSF